MNLDSILILAASDTPLMLKVIYWLLVILWAIGSIGFAGNPAVVRGTNGVLLVLFAILGFVTFGF